jgi:hypothetical protein
MWLRSRRYQLRDRNCLGEEASILRRRLADRVEAELGVLGAIAARPGRRQLCAVVLEVVCGSNFLRLGVPPADDATPPTRIVWTSPGKGAQVGCKAVTHVSLRPTK